MNLGKNVFGEIWLNDARMNALFQCFRSYQVNPQGWSNKMEEWVAAINRLCETDNFGFVLTTNNLQQAFKRKNAVPKCLDVVIQEMVKQKIIVKLSDLEKSFSNNSWWSWGYNTLVAKPVSWGFSLLLVRALGRPVLEDSIEYVHFGALKNVAETAFAHLEERFQEENENFYRVADFFNNCSQLCSKYEQFLLVLSYLESQNKVTIWTEENEKYVKLKSLDHDETSPLHEVDCSKIKLQKSLRKLESEAENQRAKIKICQDEARLALRNQNKIKASSLLRKKQRLEKILKDNMNAMENIETMINNLDKSVTQREVLNAFKAGTSAHKKLTENGIGVDQALDIMDDVQESLDNQQEISNALGFKSFISISDEELEDELNQLLDGCVLDDSKTNLPTQEELNGIVLPNVPDEELDVLPAKVDKKTLLTG